MNTLYYGDNLDILRDYIADGSIDLIYLDPPFNSNRNYNVLFKNESGTDSQSQITAFEDSWHWNMQAEQTYNELINEPDQVGRMIESFRGFIGTNQMMAYLTMMAIRLKELHRVLKPTGSLYLHCDPTASHYLKILLDTIFGGRNFRNEIIWCYRKWSVAQSQFVSNHDVILFYSKHDRRVNTFNTLFAPLSPGTLKRWKGQKQQAVFDEQGRRLATNLEDKSEGSPMADWWEISIINPAAKERLGYPTQKPLELIERIISASSNEGDVVLDPFCGCGTTIAAAQKLNREWIGIDITHLSVGLQKLRLMDSFNLTAGKDYRVIGQPTSIGGARELAEKDKYGFQWWVLPLIGAKAFGSEAGKKVGKKGADGGIDGMIVFTDDNSGRAKRVIVSVKGGDVNVSQIRDLVGTVEREKAAIGLFVTLEPPTKPMEKEAAEAGFYHSHGWNKDYPKIQILTVKEILNGTQPDLPPNIQTFKKAERAVTDDPAVVAQRLLPEF
ncbi:MAG: restriction endonuclease [Acidobacteriota bacterium]|nr:MAG: restriction endonuclease [Acidobacteriota bacterium]